MTLREYSDFYSDEELESAIKIFQIYFENPSLKRHAFINERVKFLFEISRKVLAPTKREAKVLNKEKDKERRRQDYEKLNATQIRKSRGLKLVASSTGSIDMEVPPKMANLIELENYCSKEDASGDVHHEEYQSKQRLNFNRSCHICSTKFNVLHHFYDQLCPKCAEFNFNKRSHKANMTGHVCLVTGARIKIGYCIALKLLRMDAIVVITTRFPHDAAVRYAKEADFNSFRHRLHIYGIDFRDLQMVHSFCKDLKRKFNRLDVIINNAAQTVRKPTIFYKHLMENEQQRLSDDLSFLVTTIHRSNCGYKFLTGTHNSSKLDLDSIPLNSALMSQIQLADHDFNSNQEMFPSGLLDRDDQQVDLRVENSWIQELGQISTFEMLECHVINAFAPWVIISELKSLMEFTKSHPTSHEKCDKYIVNVSAMEGQFYRPKTTNHPHSNMAKASLNMLTRTAAAGFASIDIYMTAVDTGWITNEDPIGEWDKRKNSPPPLDEWDAAMRVLDPVLKGINGEEKIWGVFLKNYNPTRW